MGAANVIPGVSGGTIAFITGIYEELINSLKSFDVEAIKLLTSFRFKAFAQHINLPFLVVLFAGVGVSLVTLGKALKFLFENYEVPVWAFFFGLIIASVYFVGKTIKQWSLPTILMTLLGTAIAVALAFIKPAQENTAYWYLFICGVVAMASMLLPGLSGSFVLILMGNYAFIMLEAIPNHNIPVIASVGVGAVVGFIILSRVISFLMGSYESQTIGALTGFIFGSLLIIWPWKNKILLLDQAGNPIVRKGKEVVMGYDWLAPDFSHSQTMIAFALMVLGAILVWGVEFLGSKATKEEVSSVDA